MKKQLLLRSIFLYFLFVFSFSFGLFAQDGGSSAQKKVLLIMNPTVGNISGINRLIREGIFPVKDITLKGVYYSKENSNYEETEKFIKKQKLSITLERVEGNLEPGNLYGKNDCSPVFERLFNESAGVIFNGGPDIPPVIYREKTNILTEITDPYRHYFEASFLFHLLGGFQDVNFTPLLEKNPGYMVVGFCLGMQTINIATGGTLIQDIPLEIYKLENVEDILVLPADQQHRNYVTNIEDSVNYFRASVHPIKIVKNSWFEKEGLVKPGENPVVVSSHHQGAEKIGMNLEVVATSMDGKIAEALINTRYPNVYAFQFHPEIPDIYNYENSYIFRPDESPESLRKVIEEGHGYEFHLGLWKKFAEVLNGK